MPPSAVCSDGMLVIESPQFPFGGSLPALRPVRDAAASSDRLARAEQAPPLLDTATLDRLIKGL